MSMYYFSLIKQFDKPLIILGVGCGSSAGAIIGYYIKHNNSMCERAMNISKGIVYGSLSGMISVLNPAISIVLAGCVLYDNISNLLKIPHKYSRKNTGNEKIYICDDVYQHKNDNNVYQHKNDNNVYQHKNDDNVYQHKNNDNVYQHKNEKIYSRDDVYARVDVNTLANSQFVERAPSKEVSDMFFSEDL